ncbi:hypothetical protein Dimus_005205, partial [Dionaea muscipula]
LQPTNQEYEGLKRHYFGWYVACEAALDEEYWTTSWLRAEAHWESMSYMRSVFVSNMKVHAYLLNDRPIPVTLGVGYATPSPFSIPSLHFFISSRIKKRSSNHFHRRPKSSIIHRFVLCSILEMDAEEEINMLSSTDNQPSSSQSAWSNDEDVDDDADEDDE